MFTDFQVCAVYPHHGVVTMLNKFKGVDSSVEFLISETILLRRAQSPEGNQQRRNQLTMFQYLFSRLPFVGQINDWHRRFPLSNVHITFQYLFSRLPFIDQIIRRFLLPNMQTKFQYLFSRLPFVGQIIRRFLLSNIQADEFILVQLVEFVIWILWLRLLYKLRVLAAIAANPLLEAVVVVSFLWCGLFFSWDLGIWEIPRSTVSLPLPPPPPQATAVHIRNITTLTCTTCIEFFLRPTPGSDLAVITDY
jgi:hypothetical protein